jgi:hypothetical protein
MHGLGVVCGGLKASIYFSYFLKSKSNTYLLQLQAGKNQ